MNPDDGRARSAARLGYLESLRRTLLKMSLTLDQFRVHFGSRKSPEPHGLSWGAVDAWLEQNPEGPSHALREEALAILRAELSALSAIAARYGGPGWEEAVDAASAEEKRAFVEAARPLMATLNAYTNLMPLETGRWSAADTQLLFLGAAFDDVSRELDG